jgi:ankyrin repeat protein
MSGLTKTIVNHIVNRRFDDAKLLLRWYPVLHAIPDGKGVFPLHYALANHAPLHLILIMVREWPAMMSNTTPITKLNPLHWTCRFNMPAEVLRFMLQEFPEEIKVWDNSFETPLMCYLKSGDRDPEVIKSLNPSGDKEYADIGDRRCGRDDVGVCRLDYKDPTLRKIYLCDMYMIDHPEGCKFLDDMDAIYCHPYVNHLHFKVYCNPEHSFMWREGSMGRNAVMFLLREKKSVKSITIDAEVSDITVFANVLQQCIHLEHLTVIFNRNYWRESIKEIILAIRHLPCIRKVTFVKALVNSEAGIALSESLVAKRSMVSIRMIQCTITPEASSAILEALRSDVDCTLRDVSLFVGHRPIRTHEATALHHDQEIRLAVAYNARVQSVREFIRLVTSRDTSGDTGNTEFKDIEGAILKDEADFDWRDHPDHLYSLLQAKPEYIKRFIAHDAVDSMSSKRQKFN